MLLVQAMLYSCMINRQNLFSWLPVNIRNSKTWRSFLVQWSGCIYLEEEDIPQHYLALFLSWQSMFTGFLIFQVLKFLRSETFPNHRQASLSPVIRQFFLKKIKIKIWKWLVFLWMTSKPQIYFEMVLTVLAIL